MGPLLCLVCLMCLMIVFDDSVVFDGSFVVFDVFDALGYLTCLLIVFDDCV